MKNQWFLGGVLLLGAVLVFGYLGHLSNLRESAAEEELARTLKEEREYSASRSKDCLAIYEAEGKKWNNVRSWRYNNVDDRCEITYKDQNRKSEEVCDKEFNDYTSTLPEGEFPSLLVMTAYGHCLDGTFVNTF